MPIGASEPRILLEAEVAHEDPPDDTEEHGPSVEVSAEDHRSILHPAIGVTSCVDPGRGVVLVSFHHGGIVQLDTNDVALWNQSHGDLDQTAR